MAKRFRLGLNLFFDNRSNSGIVNYIYNIVAALKILPESEKPEITLFCSASSPIDYIKSIDYPYCRYVLLFTYPQNFLGRKINSFLFKLTSVNFYKLFKYRDIDSLYPYFGEKDLYFVRNKVYWLVDFNNRVFPSHYSDLGKTQNDFQTWLANSRNKVVLSSNSLFDELKKYHPDYACDVRILSFASSIPVINNEDTTEVRKKFALSVPYFMCPNQFWEHKNLMIIIEALNIICKSRYKREFKILFTGSVEVNRGKGFYVDKLREKILEYNLQSYIIFLGVIDRSDQLLLMKGANALIQPSLYEGWSTLVEESKALGQFILLSDLPVHREQINENVAFFDPMNANDLAQKMQAELNASSVVKKINYSRNVLKFANDIVKALR